jgi:hypothetical protein
MLAPSTAPSPALTSLCPEEASAAAIPQGPGQQRTLKDRSPTAAVSCALWTGICPRAHAPSRPLLRPEWRSTRRRGVACAPPHPSARANMVPSAWPLSAALSRTPSDYTIVLRGRSKYLRIPLPVPEHPLLSRGRPAFTASVHNCVLGARVRGISNIGAWVWRRPPSPLQPLASERNAHVTCHLSGFASSSQLLSRTETRPLKVACLPA